MKRCVLRWLVAGASIAVALLACSSPVDDSEEAYPMPPESRAVPAAPNPADQAPLLVPPPFECRGVRDDEHAGAEQYPVPKPPFSFGVFPCTRCHDKPDDFNPKPRHLVSMHQNIQLAHGPREQWCYDCHNPTYRDKLRLAGGRLVSFERSYELCGQCHGEKLRDWRYGIHGRRIGCWNGQRQYLLCVHCHNPHAPHFRPMHPKAPPERPADIHLSRSE